MTRRVDASFTVVPGPRSALVVMSGEFDFQAGKDLGVALLQLLNESPATVSLDMTAVEFIDSSGIEMLLRLYRRVVREGWRHASGHPIVRRGAADVCGVRSS